MVYQRVAHYLWLKGDTCFFNRRVPRDMKGHYKSSRIIVCLKTSGKDKPLRSAKSIVQCLLESAIGCLNEMGSYSADVMSSTAFNPPCLIPKQKLCYQFL